MYTKTGAIRPELAVAGAVKSLKEPTQDKDIRNNGLER